VSILLLVAVFRLVVPDLAASLRRESGPGES
jgi:hypothetical protein